MKGLLYKEWATLKSSYKQTVFFIAFLYGGISKDELFDYVRENGILPR